MSRPERNTRRLLCGQTLGGQAKIAEHLSQHLEANMMRIIVDTVMLRAFLLCPENGVPLNRLTPIKILIMIPPRSISFKWESSLSNVPNSYDVLIRLLSGSLQYLISPSIA